MSELKQYVIDDEGSWALGDNFLLFIAKWLNDDKPSNDQLRVQLLTVLAAAALKDDVILILHQDRRDHVLMNYAHNIDRLPLSEQQALALFVRSFGFKFIQINITKFHFYFITDVQPVWEWFQFRVAFVHIWMDSSAHYFAVE